MNKTIIEMDKVAEVLKLLGDKTRLTMVAILKQRECCVCEFLEVFTMSQSSISQHLRKLKHAGLLNEEKRGQWVYYSLNTKSELFGLIDELLKHIPDQTEQIKKMNASKVTTRCNC
ncbi:MULTISPECIES: ArsR/SmtB family transcription factor [Bacillus]|uniref:ArsR family transcriptional regulator n=1 Tax=Bacillus glycinifermentans TaxID=1664069 RepID=A0AAJ3YZ53_9BACI|nr:MULTISPECIES: metalloregulator ArsR/SmtB family transcription factor [Bacillus]KKB73789.1 ArsR family transcriptional regulator [Bacillus sp. TH008]MDU0073096.1 metalloregulator ArsR/SmtB family transcription factor [Bacillus sp. IG6]MED8020886.1 metalloregulator ArsR/SmtB family transcription factor [Bacillus glycinifermentans]QAT65776.1 ArsR family transcriptional regulator [Bacillus glycinifermentans]WKB75476.1 metalloregulator ArsR/SmtB family transcription factor [Bacillus glyciniferme